MNIVVINKNDESFSGRFNGVSYDFAPDERVTIPVDAAARIFAYGKDEQERAKVLVRNGWQRNGIADDDYGPVKALKRLQGFIFKTAPEGPPLPKPVKSIAPAQRQQVENVSRETSAMVSKQVLIPGRRAPLAPPAA